MSRLLRRLSLRHFRFHPLQSGLAVLGVALGVAVALSIELANSSALRAFELSADAVSGRATHQLLGDSLGVPESFYSRLRLELGLRRSAPVVEGYVAQSAIPDRRLRLLGVDPLAEGEFRDYLGRSGGLRVDLAAFMTRPGAILMGRFLAAELGVATGDTLSLEAGPLRRTVEVVGVLDPLSRLDQDALADLVVADIATAQELLGFAGRLSRIDLILADGVEGERQRAAIENARPATVELVDSGAASRTAGQMTRAFRLNLRALSLLAILCGGFLIYNTITFAVIQRRPTLATLRALGVTRRELLGMVLGEALCVGLLGSLLGAVAGTALGHLLLELVTRTINDLYFVVTVRQVELDPATFARGFALGVGASLIAALAPAYEALRTTPQSALDRAELESRAHRAVPRATVAGLALLATGGVLLLASGGSLGASFTGLFSVLVGSALLTPAATIGLMTLLTPIAGALFGQLGRIAGRGVVTALSRTAVAIAALMMAVSVTIGVDLMVDSFRQTVERWLGYSLPADLYLSSSGAPGGRLSGARPGIGEELVDDLRGVAGIDGVNTVRHAEVGTPSGPLRLTAFDLDLRGRQAFAFVESRDRPWEAFAAGEAVFVSEPLAYRRGIRVGSDLELLTPAGRRSFPVAAVYYDYASEQGAAMIDGRLYRELWDDGDASALSFYLAPGAAAAEVEERVRRLAAGRANVDIRSNQSLRKRSLEVFDRTFLVTGVLRLLAVIVAFVGVLSALTALQLERARELGVMRANGLTPGELWRLVTAQTGLMGLAAGLLSIPVGIATAAIMIHVINRQSFGWSIDMSIGAGTLVEAVLLSLTAALLAGLYPAFRMARTSPAEALRGE